MKIFDAETKALDFIHLVSSKKRDLKNWQFLDVKIEQDQSDVDCAEVAQFLEFQIQSKKAVLLRADAQNQLLVFTHKDDSLILSKFEKAVYENFSSDTLRARVKGFDNDGLEQFSGCIEPSIAEGDVKAMLSLKRLKRPVNSIMVVDDDIMILKQMEKILAGYGNVVSLQNANDFNDEYEKHAPNILFLDIHLGTAQGNVLLKKLKQNTDPHAHVVMISSDTKQEMIMDIKSGGANGFVVKPPNRNNIFQNLMKAPTIVTATA